MQCIEISKIQKAIELLGLNLSDSELDELKSGNTISLESKGLSKVGSVLILAEAISKSSSGKTASDQNLILVSSEPSGFCTIPVYYCNSDRLDKSCLYLTWTASLWLGPTLTYGETINV
jgi:hypothetical protein